MRLPGKKRLIKAGRWLRSRATPGGLILGYHRVADNADDIYLNCIRPQHFAEQMAFLREHTNPISLHAFVQGLHSGSLPARAVTVTFDDGYADNLYQALPVLEQHEIPVTLFVASGYLGQRFWWDELADIFLNRSDYPAKSPPDVAGESQSRPLSPVYSKDRKKLVYDLYRNLLTQTAAERRQAMAQFSRPNGSAERAEPSSRALTSTELQTLAQSALVTIGAHSVTHPFLADMADDEQRLEIEQCKLGLESLLGRPVTTFSYPNGSSDETTRTLVREAGYICACASYNDVAGSRTDLYNLPRFWASDQDGRAFARWLRRWLPN